MPDNKTPQVAVRELVWKRLTAGIDPKNDPCGLIDDIQDNTRFAVDVAIFETAKAVLDEMQKGQFDVPSRYQQKKYLEIEKRWLVPVPEPKTDET